MGRPVDRNAKVELLRAAEAVFVEHGLERARVEEITARAGRSKGSFYLHFESKDEAFRQIVETMVARLSGFLDEMEATTHPFEGSLDQLKQAWFDREVALFEFLWQNRGVTRLLLEGGAGVDYVHLVDAITERAYASTRSMIELGAARGYYRAELDVEVASLVVAGAYDRIARQLVRRDRKPDIAAWVAGVQDVLFGGLLEPRSLAPAEARSPAPRHIGDRSVIPMAEPRGPSTASRAVPASSATSRPRRSRPRT